jgi:hypothetical protein
MRAIVKRLASAAFLVCLLATWSAHADPDVAAAQAPKPIVVARVFRGAEDLTGNGHSMRGVGTEDRLSLILPLAPK